MSWAQVAETCLQAGVPLSKLKYFREFLEEGGIRLTDTRHMLDMVLFILNQERDQVKKEIEGKCMSVIFNGTSRLSEVLAVVLRFVDSDAKIQQHLIQMMFLMKSLTGEETARELINILSVSLSPKQRLCGREQMGKSMALFSKTRWQSRWMVMHQIMVQFGDVVPFLTNEGHSFPFSHNRAEYSATPVTES